MADLWPTTTLQSPASIRRAAGERFSRVDSAYRPSRAAHCRAQDAEKKFRHYPPYDAPRPRPTNYAQLRVGQTIGSASRAPPSPHSPPVSVQKLQWQSRTNGKERPSRDTNRAQRRHHDLKPRHANGNCNGPPRKHSPTDAARARGQRNLLHH